jgi:hypothetical protein
MATMLGIDWVAIGLIIWTIVVAKVMMGLILGQVGQVMRLMLGLYNSSC